MFYIQTRKFLRPEWYDYPLEEAKATLQSAAERYWELRKVTGIGLNMRVIEREITPKGAVDREIAPHKLLDFEK